MFIIFAFSFTRPRTKRDWRSFGAFSAFVVALFTEMYGFPLTIYLLSGWLSSRYPGVDLLSHNNGHLWEVLMGWKGDPHLNPLHILSFAIIGGGFVLLATAGPYAYVRHPQYDGLFLLQWPTLLTLIMFPILVTLYIRLGRREEREVREEFGEEYAQYAATTPAFFPHLDLVKPNRA